MNLVVDTKPKLSTANMGKYGQGKNSHCNRFQRE